MYMKKDEDFQRKTETKVTHEEILCVVYARRKEKKRSRLVETEYMFFEETPKRKVC